MKSTLLFVVLCLLGLPLIALAQENPTIEILLSQPNAQKGDVVTASVQVGDATNVAGADIGIIVDERCLRILDRTPGTLLPSSSETGGFSPFAELHDHDTRFAAAITDRTKVANGEGIFYSVQMEVICAKGVAPISIVLGEFSSYVDPSAEQIELTSYTMEQGNVTTVDAALIVGNATIPETPAGQPPKDDEDNTLYIKVVVIVGGVILLVILLVILIGRGRIRSKA